MSHDYMILASSEPLFGDSICVKTFASNLQEKLIKVARSKKETSLVIPKSIEFRLRGLLYGKDWTGDFFTTTPILEIRSMLDRDIVNYIALYFHSPVFSTHFERDHSIHLVEVLTKAKNIYYTFLLEEFYNNLRKFNESMSKAVDQPGFIKP